MPRSTPIADGFAAPGGSGYCGSAASCSNGPTRTSTRPGGLRRVHLRHHPNILKRVLVHVCGFNLGLLMRQLTGVGTPRSLQGRAAAICTALIGLLAELWEPVRPSWAVTLHNPFVSWENGVATALST